MLLLVIAVDFVIIGVAMLSQALAAFSAAGPWLWVPCAFGIGVLAVAEGAIAANDAWDTLAGRFRWTVRVTLGVMLTVGCLFYAALMFIVPFRAWERHDDFWEKVLVGLFAWGTSAAFAYGGWHTVKSLVLGGKGLKRIDRRQTPPGRRRYDQVASGRSERARRYDEAAIGYPGERGEGGLGGGAHAGSCHCDPGGGSGFNRMQECDICGYVRNMDDRYPTHARCDLLKHLQPLSADRGFKIVEPGNMTTRTRQARDEPASNRIGYIREDDRD